MGTDSEISPDAESQSRKPLGTEPTEGEGYSKPSETQATQDQGRMVPRPTLESSLLLFHAEVQVLPTPKGSDQLLSLTVHENQIQGLLNMFP